MWLHAEGGGAWPGACTSFPHRMLWGALPSVCEPVCVLRARVRACVRVKGVKYNIQGGQIRDYPSAKRQAGFGFGDLQMESWEFFCFCFFFFFPRPPASKGRSREVDQGTSKPHSLGILMSPHQTKKILHLGTTPPPSLQAEDHPRGTHPRAVKEPRVCGFVEGGPAV